MPHFDHFPRPGGIDPYALRIIGTPIKLTDGPHDIPKMSSLTPWAPLNVPLDPSEPLHFLLDQLGPPRRPLCALGQQIRLLNPLGPP